MSNPHLVLFFTEGVSLETWADVGNLAREVALYQRLADRGLRVTFVTYGDHSDLEIASTLPGIEVRCNAFGLPESLYRRGLPLIHAATFLKADVIKSNQLRGSDLALRAAKLWRKPMLARFGFSHVEFERLKNGEGSPQHLSAQRLEAAVLPEASAIEVTTEAMRDEVVGRFPGLAPRTQVIPNYVDEAVFYPATDVATEWDVIFIGRLEKQKNLPSLLEALAGQGLKTAIVGEGSLAEELKGQAKTLDLDIDWLGNRPNTELAGLMHRAKVFVLPSHFEGHPKTLIEAMVSGACVVGTDVAGTGAVIDHERSGLLCTTDAQSIRAALQRALVDEGLRKRLSQTAAETARARFGLTTVADQEYQLIQRLAAKGG
ncbi:MAG: glycosyltransferase family 4 protein [Magnetovibrionaceae bacterium]